MALFKFFYQRNQQLVLDQGVFAEVAFHVVYGIEKLKTLWRRITFVKIFCNDVLQVVQLFVDVAVVLFKKSYAVLLSAWLASCQKILNVWENGLFLVPEVVCNLTVVIIIEFVYEFTAYAVKFFYKCMYPFVYCRETYCGVVAVRRMQVCGNALYVVAVECVYVGDVVAERVDVAYHQE